MNPKTTPDVLVPTGRWSLAAAFIGVLALLGTAGSMLVLRTHRQAVAPDDVSLGLAAKILARDVRKGDAIAFHPAWSASQHWRFAEAYQKAALDFDASLIVSEPKDLWDADGFKRLWIVSTHDRAATLQLPNRRLRDEDLDHGTELLLYDLGTSRTVYDLRKNLKDAVVERQQPDGTFKKCAWNGQKHACGGEWWQDVWDTLHEVGNSRHPGIFLQPVGKKMISRVTWPHPVNLQNSGGRVLAGRVGLRLWAVRNDEGTDTQVRALVGEREVWKIVLPRGDFVWHPFEVNLRPEEAGLPVLFEWQADDPNWRQTALDARILDAAPVVNSPVVPPASAPAAAVPPPKGPADGRLSPSAFPSPPEPSAPSPDAAKEKRAKRH